MATTVFVISYLLSLIFLTHTLGYPYIPIWLLVSYAAGFMVVILVYLFHFPIILALRSTHPYKAYLMKSIAKFMNHLVIRLKVSVTGLENIPKTGRLVVYANHKAYSDAFALLEVFNRPLTFTPKKSVLSVPILKQWLKAYDVFPINRKNHRETAHDLEHAISTVQKGLAISIFPEGHIKYRHEQKVTEMKSGAFKLALKAEADILVIRLDGNQLTKKRTPFKSTSRHLTILPVYPYASFKEKTTSEIAAEVMKMINEAENKEIVSKTNGS
jgi:1-acyl-sn-glycerol-3-phosphate acyltransferase